MSAEDESPSNTNEAVSLQFLEFCQFLHWNETATGKDDVTVDQAKEIAFTHDGLTKAEVTFVKAKLDTDDTGKNIVNQSYPIFQSFTSILFFLNVFLWSYNFILFSHSLSFSTHHLFPYSTHFEIFIYFYMLLFIGK